MQAHTRVYMCSHCHPIMTQVWPKATRQSQLFSGRKVPATFLPTTVHMVQISPNRRLHERIGTSRRGYWVPHGSPWVYMHFSYSQVMTQQLSRYYDSPKIRHSSANPCRP